MLAFYAIFNSEMDGGGEPFEKSERKSAGLVFLAEIPRLTFYNERIKTSKLSNSTV